MARMKIKIDEPVAGVSFDRQNNKWRARYAVGTNRIFLGRFDTRRDAVIARKTAELVVGKVAR